MRRILLVFGLLVGVLIVVAQVVQSQPQPNKEPSPQGQDKPKDQPAKERAADAEAIRGNIEAFAKAYNTGNAKAIGALFTAEAIAVDKEGITSEGRDAIEKTFANLFKEAPQRRIEVFLESIRFLGPDLAVEVGSTRETVGPGEEPRYDRYTVLHVKRDGKWLMALARDAEGPPPTPHERLRQLAWLVGDWVDDSGNVVVASTCRWSEDGNFLLQEFQMKVQGRDAMRVSQRIGWDPLAGNVRSWVFDSEGGYGEGVWARDGDVWLIKATGVRPDGTTASATNVLVPTGKDGYVWRSTDRVVAGAVAAPIEVKVVRKPPQPKP